MGSLEELRVNVAAARRAPLDAQARTGLEARMNGTAVAAG